MWDASGASWRHLKIAIQPASVLVNPDGTVRARFATGLHLEDVLKAAEG